MSEMLQLVRTVFSADSTGMRSELNKLGAATRQQVAGLKSMENEVNGIMRDVAAAESRLAAMPVKVQKGFTNTANKTLFAPDIVGDLQQLISGGETAMADPWMLAELERMKAAATHAKPPVSALKVIMDEAAATGGKASANFGDFKNQVNGTLGPLKFMRENLGFLAFGAMGVIDVVGMLGSGIVELLDLLTHHELDAFSASMLDSADSSFRLTQGLAKVAEQARLTFVPLEALRKTVVGLQVANALARGDDAMADRLGRQQDASTRGGALKKLADDVRAAQKALPQSQWAVNQGAQKKRQLDAEYLELQKRASRFAASPGLAAAPEFYDVARAIGQNRAAYSANEGAMFANSEAVKHLKGEIPLLNAQLDAMREEAARVQDGVLSFPEMEITRSHGRTSVNIDARNGRYTVNTRLETDDPARFADVALKSAFLSAAARPLAATLQNGASALATGSR